MIYLFSKLFLTNLGRVTMGTVGGRANLSQGLYDISVFYSLYWAQGFQIFLSIICPQTFSSPLHTATYLCGCNSKDESALLKGTTQIIPAAGSPNTGSQTPQTAPGREVYSQQLNNN